MARPAKTAARPTDTRVAMVAEFAALVHAHFAGDPVRADSARAELRRSGVAVEFLPAHLDPRSQGGGRQ